MYSTSGFYCDLVESQGVVKAKVEGRSECFHSVTLVLYSSAREWLSSS